MRDYMNNFSDIKNRFGFGCMRLKMDGENIDYNEFSKMIDLFIESGYNYFDTAHGYIDKKSETAIRDCLVKRHPSAQRSASRVLRAPYIKITGFPPEMTTYKTRIFVS